MMSQAKILDFTRSELRNNQELIRKYSHIVRKEELESDYPIPVPENEFYETRYSLDPFPFDETHYVLAENDTKAIAYGIINSNLKINNKMAFIFVYVLPEYRGQKMSKIILTKLSKYIPTYVDKIFFPIREDRLGPYYDLRKSLINHLLATVGPVTFKGRRCTSDLTKFNTNEVIKKAEELQDQAIQKGFSCIFIEGKPDFDKIGFTLPEYLKFLDSIDNDMPRENASFQDVEITPEIFNYRIDTLQPLGRTKWHYIAIHTQSKKIAGLTEVVFERRNPKVIRQADTGVIRAYRGNKLGLTLKYLMLAKILITEQSKNAQLWTTFNAYSNSYMIGINTELGHKEDAIFYQFEIAKEKFIELLKKE